MLGLVAVAGGRGETTAAERGRRHRAEGALSHVTVATVVLVGRGRASTAGGTPGAFERATLVVQSGRR